MTRRPFPRVRIAARHPGTSPFAVAAWFAMVAALGVLGEGHAEAQPTTVGSLDAELAELVRTSGLEGRVGIHVRDVQTDLAVFAHRADAPLHPASNAKVFTVYAALRVLGPAHRFRTAVYGATDAEGTAKSVALVGDGDPSLTGSHLAWLARRLRDRGLRHVRQVVVDESAFDDAVLPPGYGEQPGENAAFRAAVAPLAVDHAAFTVTVAPGSTTDDPARVWSDAPGYVEIENRVSTRAGPTRIALARAAGARVVRVVLTGSIAPGTAPYSLRQRSEDPRWQTAARFVAALRAVGIAVDGEAHLGPRPADAPLLEEHLSPPLARLAQLLGKESDNFAAEMLTKALGRAKGDTGSTATGLRAITEALAPLHLGDAVRLENGSGLFGESRATPASVTAALAAGALDAAIAPEFLAAFAVAGRDGTLKGRLGDVPAGRVRAKTGTLRNVSALSGWVLDVRGEPRFAFSVLANDVGGKIDSAKRLADGVVRALVRASDARTAGETAR